MEIFIPIAIITLALVAIANYALVVFLRRRYMLDKVLKFIDRDDTSDFLKTVARDAFEDTLSLKLPLDLYRERQKRVSLTRHEKNKHTANMKKLMKSSAEVEAELREIIDMMFCLNHRLTFLLEFFLKIKDSAKSINVRKEFDYMSTQKCQH
ncbi:hypothetical protein [Photobacterium profundum]|uniref:hypothetical protein n=1 Tax=Photobacterium profundum TaxID=74109 RepID=UPI003D12E082